MKGMIIGVGFHKTGTSTLREALTILGYRVKDTSPRALIPILKGDFNRIRKMLDGYDAAEDTPWFMIYRELDRLYPGSKFILTIRDQESWYRSISNHIGNLRSAHHEWIYGRGKGIPALHRENSIAKYNAHNSSVKAYFSDRPEDLLIVDFTRGDGWPELCSFLDRDEPLLPFPHENKTSELTDRQKLRHGSLKYHRKSLKNHLKIKMIDLLRLWP